LDRIDSPTKFAYIEVPRVEYDKLTDDGLGERSEAMRARAEKVGQVQGRRFAGTSLICNAGIGPAEVSE